MPRAMLICCEGDTEKRYFEILRTRVFRIPQYVVIRIEGSKGQHKSLIDQTIEVRRQVASNEDLVEEEIECWAVCDDDNMPFSFAELKRYAEGRGVMLAFSRPQFESYLLQHFEQSKETCQDELYRRLGKHMEAFGFSGRYEKTNLAWLEKALVDNPKLVKTAITNSELRTRQSSSPFFTVHDLTKRLMEFRLE